MYIASITIRACLHQEKYSPLGMNKRPRLPRVPYIRSGDRMRDGGARFTRLVELQTYSWVGKLSSDDERRRKKKDYLPIIEGLSMDHV